MTHSTIGIFSAAMPFCAALLFAPAIGHGNPQPQKVTYEQDGTKLVGALFLPDGASAERKRTAVIVFPEWWGNNDYAQKRAQDLAKEGYIGFAADLFGDGKVAKDRSEAASLAGPLFQNRSLLRARANAAVETLKAHELVDPEKIVATGYCLGGATSLELARTGAPISAAFSFHGALNFPEAITTGTKAIPVFILNGKDDPMIPPTDVEKAEAEFKAAGFPVTVVQYEGAVHSFTNPAAGDDPKKGSAYDEAADKDSHARLFRFLARGMSER